jgi:tetraacyldisaccharide 4'-kinase
MRAPGFWMRDGILPRLLSPASAVYAAAAARRLRRPGWRAPVPVLCCGAATVGGAGKTPLALDLGARLLRAGRCVAFVSRGYGRRGTVPRRVHPGQDSAEAVGDEPLLLAALAPTYVAADRAAAARLAVAEGADGLVMDDGLQNPGLEKTLSLLAVDHAVGFGNGRVLPAGPLREPVARAARRCQAAVLIGMDRTAPLRGLPDDLPILYAALLPQPLPVLQEQSVFAFAGIARPQKFLASARQAGARIAGWRGFPDHHAYRPSELRRLAATAAASGSILLTTAKDAVRLPPDFAAGVTVLRVDLVWRDAAAPDRLLAGLD